MKKILFFLLLLPWCVQAQSYRVEPAFWWAGMKNTELQLLVHGPNASAFRPEINYHGVSITQSVQVKSPNYLFVYLKLSPQVQPGQFDIAFKKDGKTAYTYTYRLLPREQGSATREGFNASDVMYLITPDRFANGNPANDEVPSLLEKPNRSFKGGRHGGDIQGIANHLDYFKDMGFTAVWINPVLENNQPVYSYHGYSTTDYYKVDTRFGSNEEYQALAKKAKEKGIKLIMDMIVNHCGSGHWWMKDLPTDDWLNFQEKYQITNHHREVMQDPYASEEDKRLQADGWFVESMPDLNQRNPLMATYLIQNTIWWIEYADLAGIRMDTYSYPDRDFMARWTREVMAEYPRFNIVGEEWSNQPQIVAFWQAGKQNPNGYTSELRSVMDFPLQSVLAPALTEQEQMFSAGLIKLYRMLSYDFLYPNPKDLVVFPDNHDMSRIFTQVNEDKDYLKMVLAYTLVTRGIPQIYYGTEALLANPGTDDHGIIRTDFPGGWAGDKVNIVTEAGITEAQKEVKHYLRKLLQWRKGEKVIHEGDLKHFAPENGVYLLCRYLGKERVLLVMNKNNTATTLALPRFAEVIQGAQEATNVISGEKLDLSNGSLAIPAKTALILKF